MHNVDPGEPAMPAIALDVKRRWLILDGRESGPAGASEKVVGTLRFAADPTHPLQTQITDLDRAPRSAAGQVEFQGDFYLLTPVDPARGNRRLLLDVANRGRKIALSMFNSAVRVPDPAAAEDFGNGFLLRHGWTVAWIGWQHDVPRQDGMMALDVPRARGVSGLVRCGFHPNLPADGPPLSDRYHIPNPVAELDDPTARLTVREHNAAAPVAVPRSALRLPDPSRITLAGGFVPGRIYDLVYRALDPPIVGLGFLAVRDTAAFLRWAPAGQGNPCAGALERAYVFGVSQSGRFLRHLLYLGLDETEDGRLAFDAVVPHVAGARRGEVDLRFRPPPPNPPGPAGTPFPSTGGGAPDPGPA